MVIIMHNTTSMKVMKTRGSMVFFTLDLYGTVLFKYHTFSDFSLVSIFIGDFPTVYL